MEMPLINRLEANDRPVLAIIGAVRPDYIDIAEPLVFNDPTHHFADILAAALFALLAGADIKDFRWCVLFFRHNISAAFDSKKQKISVPKTLVKRLYLC